MSNANLILLNQGHFTACLFCGIYQRKCSGVNTIENHVDLADLKLKIDEYDEHLCDYYKTTKVEFSNGDAVDFDNADESITCKKLASRIYKTRNSIVHSKESEKSKYMPFRDDKMLVKEVPLLRFIAEQIIIDSSSIVG